MVHPKTLDVNIQIYIQHEKKLNWEMGAQYKFMWPVACSLATTGALINPSVYLCG